MSGGNDTPSNTTTTQRLDPFIKEQVKGNLDFVNNIIDKGYQPYNGPGVAGLNGQVTSGMQGLQNLAGGNNQWQGLLEQAAQGTQAAGGYTPEQVDAGQADIGQFMNPYTDQVVNSTLSDIDRARAMAVNQTQDQALAAGAFNGSRSALADAMTNSEYARAAGSVAGQLRSQGFNTALGAAQNQQGMDMQAALANQSAGLDQNRLGLLASGQLGQLGQTGNAMQTGNLQNSINAGLLGQQNTQAQNDWAFQQYLAEQNWPIQMANLRTSAIGGSPQGGSTTQTAPGGGSNRFGSALGGAATGAAMGSAFGPVGTVVGGGVGLLGGMFA